MEVEALFVTIVENHAFFSWAIVWTLGAFLTWVVQYQSGGLPSAYLSVLFVMAWPWGLANVLIWYWVSRLITADPNDANDRFLTWLHRFISKHALSPTISYMVLPVTFPLMCARWLRSENRRTI